jgi:hypothetical protein
MELDKPSLLQAEPSTGYSAEADLGNSARQRKFEFGLVVVRAMSYPDHAAGMSGSQAASVHYRYSPEALLGAAVIEIVIPRKAARELWVRWITADHCNRRNAGAA